MTLLIGGQLLQICMLKKVRVFLKILKFSCKEKSNLNLICESSDGVFSLINLNNGYIGNSNLIYKIIINSKSNYIEKILNEDGKAIIVTRPI